MPSHRDACLRSGRLAALQSLRAMASQSRAADARKESEAARSKLANCDDALALATMRIDALFSADTLDLFALQISRNVLNEVASEQDMASTGLAGRAAEEEQRRSDWNRELHLEDRTLALSRQASRHHAAKLENAAALEAAELRLAHPRRRTAR